MLELTLATQYVPGSNVKGSPVGASWRFILPSLELGSCVCFGVPSPAVLEALAQTASRVTVLADDLGVATTLLRGRGTPVNVEVAPDPLAGGSWPAPGSVDLVVLVSRRWQRRLAKRRNELERLLSPRGILFAERRGRGVARNDRLLWLAPPLGEVTAVAEADDRAVRRFLGAHLRADSGVRRRLPERARRFVRTSRLTAAARPRRALLAGHPGPRHSPPTYVAEIAREAGVDLAGWRAGISAPGRYSSKKILCFLFPPDADRPECVAKMTRDPAFNARLENEHRALSWLAKQWPRGRQTFPEPLFQGHHAGLAVSGQRHLDGVPLRTRTTGRPDCPRAAAVVDWLTELAVATVETTPPEEVARALSRLLETYAKLYKPSPGEMAFLERQLAVIGESPSPFPLVFQHGDPGIWNALATPSGIAFLDWEAAEPRGMPLWDLFYFARSAWASGRSGAKAASIGLPRPALWRYCDRIGLRRSLAVPLLYACWMHRALKEATRLAPERLPRGQFVTLLRTSIASGTGLEEA